jgi:hypothetical protein
MFSALSRTGRNQYAPLRRYRRIEEHVLNYALVEFPLTLHGGEPRIRESRKGRPCNKLGLSAHCLGQVLDPESLQEP